MIRTIALTVLLGVLAAGSAAAELSPRTVAAFDRYIAHAEAVIAKEQSSPESFLAVRSLPPAQRTEAEVRLRRGEVLVESRNLGSREIPGGLIHHWRGLAFIPKASVSQVLGLVKDYDHLASFYSPEVVSSRLVAGNGDDLHISMRLRKHKVVTVVLDTEYDVHYGRLDAAHQFSVSRSTRVSEVANPGERNEHVLDTQHNHGFMWRLNSYWRFEQASDGVLVQCEAISLTRDVPTGLGWLIGPFVQDIPKESLQFTLAATRTSVLSRSAALAQTGVARK